MASYYLNDHDQSSGDHEVHHENCSYLPSMDNRIFLGNYNSCHGAVLEAKTRYPQAKIDGCFYCCIDCHKR